MIGSGVAGLTAGYLLARRYEVLLFEADDRLGGHAHTHDVRTADGRTIGVDSGFIVHNERTYPNLAPAVRRTRRGHAGHRDVDERALRGLRP